MDKFRVLVFGLAVVGAVVGKAFRHLMKLQKFGEVVPGTRFRYENGVYVKTRMNMAMGADRKRIIFPSEAEVQVLERDNRPGEKTRSKGR